MRKLLLILSVLTFSLCSCGQDYKEYNFKDIGLHINLPDKFVFQDTFPKPSFLDANGRQITDKTKLQNLEADLMKGLLVVSSPDRNNTASFNLAMKTAKTGNLEEYYDFSKDMQQLMAKQQMNNFDTASSVLTADGIKVQKFMTCATNAIPTQYGGIYLAQVGKYFLVIKADYTDKKFGEEIEKAIQTAKFD
ncbi:MAG: hypothetical protein EOO10_24415 [Chitinophagaceae bacterium]|nr:MAG: hypothetical protein EOO10_24415 [Chitinophagaceae bacterium]